MPSIGYSSNHFLRRDGLLPMTGNLDLDTYMLLFADMAIWQGSSSRIDFGTHAKGLRDIGARTLFMDNLRAYHSNQVWYTGSAADRYIQCQSHDGSIYQEVMKILGGYVNIPRAGDITQLAGKTASLMTLLVDALGSSMAPDTDNAYVLGGTGYNFIRVHTYSLGLKPKASGNAVEGNFYYDSGAQKLKFYNGTAWETVTSA